jgi:hypothetical protein
MCALLSEFKSWVRVGFASRPMGLWLGRLDLTTF